MKNYIKIMCLAFATTAFAQVGINTTTPESELDVNGDLTISRDTGNILFSSDNGNTISVGAPVGAADYDIVLPDTAGQPGESLVTDGAGNLDWQSLNFAQETLTTVVLRSSHPSRDFPIITEQSNPGSTLGNTLGQETKIDYEEIIADPGNNFNLATDTFTVPQEGAYLISVTINASAAPPKANPFDTGNYYPINLEVFNETTNAIVFDTTAIRYDTEEQELAFGVTVSGLAPLQVGDEIITRIELGSSNKLPSEVAEVRTFSPVTGPNVDLAITTNGGIVYPDTFTFSDDTEVQAVWTIVRI